MAQRTQPSKAQSEPAKTPQGAPLSPEQLFEKASPAVVYIVVRDGNFKPIGLGSGFFVDAAGLIVTNFHVIKGAEFATARLSTGATLFVDGVVATDPDSDLALLKVSGAASHFLKTGDGTLPKVGSTVYAIGNPKGLENTFSSGMVSGHREIEDGLTAIQVTTPVSPGSSGGPLLNASGEVVGVTSASLTSGQNLNFAVPVAAVNRLIQRQGKVQTLASAGGGRLEKAETDELDKAWEAIATEDWRGASEILIRLRKSEQDNPFVWFALGYLHLRLGNEDAAIQHYKQAIALKPDFAEAYRWMGRSYLSLECYAEAVDACKKAIAVKPDFADAYCDLGDTYMGQSLKGLEKKYSEAIVAYKQAVAIKPDYPNAYYWIGLAYQGMEKHSEAIDALKQAIALKPDYATAYFWMGWSYEELGHRTAALAAYQESLRLEPKGRVADLARDWIRRVEKQAESARQPVPVPQLPPATPVPLDPRTETQKRVDQRMSMYENYKNAGLTSKALAILRSLVKEFPNTAEVKWVEVDLKELDKYLEAIALKSADANAWYGAGSVYEKLGLLAEAIAAYKQAIAIKPDHADAYYRMGFIYECFQEKPLDAEAVEAFKKAIAIKPDYATAYFWMGCSYGRLGQRAAALTAFQQYLRLQPAGEFADSARRGLQDK